MHRVFNLVMLGLLMGVIGCHESQATLDCTNQQTLEASIKAMAAPLSDEDQRAFAGSIGVEGMGQAMKEELRQIDARLREGKPFMEIPKEPDDVCPYVRHLHGLTAQEIIAKGKERSVK